MFLFTNVAITGQELGLKDYTPPYLAPSTGGPLVLRGVNYASGGGGILNETGMIFGGRINLDAQLDNFANTRQDIISRIGFNAAQKLLNGALFSVTIGSNDFINNYLTPILSTFEQNIVPPEAFVGTLITRFRLQLIIHSTIQSPLALEPLTVTTPPPTAPSGRALDQEDIQSKKEWFKDWFDHISSENDEDESDFDDNPTYLKRRFSEIVVPNVGPIGCIPYQRDINPSAGDNCVALPNHLAQLYNFQLKSLLKDLTIQLKGSSFLFADVYNIVTDIIQNFQSYGFDNGNSVCCYLSGQHGGLIPCGPASKVCADRSKYAFSDPYHPSDATKYKHYHNHTFNGWRP
ncbi:hypothetical protein L2E82_49118 [Cichorium intybus]|uniref:Uncharacterized protein n=1 Tax=Cichorium intybus TaxID=13427 RepID=A0ACB8YZQ0_CICIN|nr:hypothetical protein L2E82_49118 [Cichorium intybus]